MTKSTKNHLLRLFIILGFLLTTFVLFYIFLLDTTLKNESSKLSFEKHLLDHEVLNDRLNTLLISYQNDEITWPTKDYDDSILIIQNFENIEIGKLSSLFNDEISNEIYLILKHETLNQVAYLPFKEVLSTTGLSLKPHDAILNKDGFIVYHEDILKIGENFFTSDLLPSNLYNELDQLMSNEESHYINYKSNNEHHILSYTTLTNNYKYVTTQLRSDYLVLFYPVIWSYLALSVLTLILFLVFSLLTIKRRFDDDVVFTKLSKTKESNLFILEVGGLGQIRNSNSYFNKSISDFNAKLITDLTSQYLDIKTLLKNKIPFYLNLDKLNQPLKARFFINKHGRNYQLIGEVINEQSNVLDKYKDLAILNRDTGLKNRLGLEEKLNELDRRSKFSLAIFTIKDIDKIKESIGKARTNEVINSFLNIIQSNIYQDMEIFHTDRSEFTILYTKDSHYDVTVSWARNLIIAVDKTVLIPDLPVKPIIDCGILHNQGNVSNMSSKEIIDALDITLERANVSSSSNLQIYTERFLDFRNQTNQLEQDIRKGILKDEFEMYMQPQYDLSLHRIKGFELLLRWNNPKYQKESPATYIKQAEKSNLIIDLGRVINEKTFIIAKTFEDTDLEFSFNISPRQLLQPGFINEFIDLKDKYQIDPAKIAIELTENILILQLDIITDKLQALKDIGFKIQLDDFGTGYSSLAYLKQLPIDIIKIDKTFVDEIETSGQSRQILRTMINLGKNLKLGVIVEGVETEKQVEIIKKESGAMIQGFFISKPIPLNEAKALLKKGINV
ncbi:EAL domain-containing protein [Acholeplasma granularum]|uniref:EAL domain-containing protein n=1 Tax=Acholeplasma granularum TaxID=264635 RepID=UPI00046F5166|nr:EAL domain-containing protein [Acholeplasma granularum]